jgi:hypothetical protein
MQGALTEEIIRDGGLVLARALLRQGDHQAPPSRATCIIIRPPLEVHDAWDSPTLPPT